MTGNLTDTLTAALTSSLTDKLTDSLTESLTATLAEHELTSQTMSIPNAPALVCNTGHDISFDSSQIIVMLTDCLDKITNQTGNGIESIETALRHEVKSVC